MATLAQASCTHHPDRRGFALCMSCRKVVCQECATTFEGKNFCRPCLLLREAAESAAQRKRPPLWIAFVGLGLAAAALAAYAMAWSSAVTARLW